MPFDWSALSKSLGDAGNTLQNGEKLKLAREEAERQKPLIEAQVKNYNAQANEAETKLWEAGPLKDFHDTEDGLMQATASKNTKLADYYRKRYDEMAPSITAQGAKYGRSIPVLNADIVTAMGDQAGEANRLMSLFASPQGAYMSQADQDKAVQYARMTIKDPSQALNWITDTQKNHQQWKEDDAANADVNRVTGGQVKNTRGAEAVNKLGVTAVSDATDAQGNVIPGKVDLGAKLPNSYEAKAGAQETKDDAKIFNETYKDLINPKTGIMGTTPVGMAVKRVKLGSDGLRLIEQVRSGKVVGTKSVSNELAANLASMIIAGQVGVEATKEFNDVDKTSKAAVAGVVQSILSKPQSAISKTFLSNMEEQIGGQIGYWAQDYKNQYDAMNQRLDGYYQKNPQKKSQIDNAFKMANPNMEKLIQKYGSSTGTESSSSAAPAQLSTEDQQAVDWAKANANDPRAKQILQLHGM